MIKPKIIEEINSEDDPVLSAKFNFSLKQTMDQLFEDFYIIFILQTD